MSVNIQRYGVDRNQTVFVSQHNVLITVLTLLAILLVVVGGLESLTVLVCNCHLCGDLIFY